MEDDHTRQQYEALIAAGAHLGARAAPVENGIVRRTLDEQLADKFARAMNKADTLQWIVRALRANPPAKHVEKELNHILEYFS